MSIDNWLELTRWTARVGLPLFLVFYVTRRRTPWLQLFAFTHTVHLLALTMYLYQSDESRTLLTVAVGGLGYLAIYVMAARPAHPWITVAGANLVFVIFTSSYVGRLLEPDRRAVGAYGTTLLVIAALARMASALGVSPIGQQMKRFENERNRLAGAEAITKNK